MFVVAVPKLAPIFVPLTVSPVKLGLAVVCRSCGVLIFAYDVPTATVTPYVPARLNVLPPATVAVPVVPATVNDVLIAFVVTLVTRPLLSTTIVGTLELEPYVPALTPVVVKLNPTVPTVALAVISPVLAALVTATVDTAILPAAVIRPLAFTVT